MQFVHLTSMCPRQRVAAFSCRDKPVAEVRQSVQLLQHILCPQSQGQDEPSSLSEQDLVRLLRRNQYDVGLAANEYFRTAEVAACNFSGGGPAGLKRQCGIRDFTDNVACCGKPVRAPLEIVMSSGGKLQALAVSELEQRVPCALVLDVLPDALATRLLLWCRDDSKEWPQPTWNVNDRPGTAHHLSAVFDIDTDTPRQSRSFVTRDPGGMREDLRMARDVIVEAVNRVVAQGPTPGHPSAGGRWESNFTLANWYRDVDDKVGAHSDDLSDIGPRPIIASVSFGAARLFRLRAVTADAAGGERGVDATPLDEGDDAGKWYGVRLPHNSLLVMLPGCQEHWKHEVPAEKAERVVVHPLVGAARLNLTFRYRRSDYVARNPLCKCGHRCKLKPVFKDGPSKGRYFWQCAGKRVPRCDFFQWDDVATTEAAAPPSTWRSTVSPLQHAL